MKNEFLKRSLSSIIIVPLVIYIVIIGSFFFNMFIIVCFFIASFEWYKMNIKNSFKYCGIFFLTISFYTVYELRNNINNGLDFFLLVLTICVATDLGGYFFGKLFKGPKLTKISPNKTYSGVIGSFLFPIVFIYILGNFYILDFISNNSFIKIIFFIFVISTISQIGDIAVSYFKRISKIKNTGKIIPGHGGLLDRIDGMIFAFPVSYIIYLFAIIKL